MATTARVGILQRPLAPTGVWSWITTVDHKRIGILYGVTALIMFLIGGLEALAIRAQLATSDANVISAETFNALFTMHGTTMVFMVVMPAGAAFFNFLIPLMIGARDVAFPRLNAFSYWLFLFGTVLMNVSFLAGAAPDSGWFGYAPLTANTFTPSASVDYWVLGLQVLGLGTLIAGFNFVVTILNLRAPGMTLMRMPVFVWMTLIISFLIIFAFPVLTIALTLLMFDRFFGTNFFAMAAGADPLLWQHFFWIFGHPEVYILILPAMGIVSDVLPTFARKPLFGYATVVFAGAAIAFLGFGVWAHHMFTVGLGAWATGAFAVATMTIAVPTGVKIFNWMATLYGGSLRFQTPMLFALGFILMFMLGGLSGVMHASVPVDTQQQDSYFVVAHFHYVLFGGSVFGLMAGIYYWFPKFTGRMLREGIGKVHFWIMLIGFNLTFMPMHVLGVLGMPRRIYTYSADQGWDLLNGIVSAGAFIIAISLLVFLYNVWTSLRNNPRVTTTNPWGASTLEWSIPNPPPVYNFAVVPTVRSLHPLWDEDANPIDPPALPPVDARAIHMPSPSYWPVVLAGAITLLAAGLLIWKQASLPGLVIMMASGVLMLYSLFRFAVEPATEPVHGHGAHGAAAHH
ncbi:MAG: cytochrome c oxidase subunit I [SAR202 cluster bacterium]|nr:cytochrome c oxidase subunit I [SAR202 cluster bacterium]